MANFCSTKTVKKRHEIKRKQKKVVWKACVRALHMKRNAQEKCHLKRHFMCSIKDHSKCVCIALWGGHTPAYVYFFDWCLQKKHNFILHHLHKICVFWMLPVFMFINCGFSLCANIQLIQNAVENTVTKRWKTERFFIIRFLLTQQIKMKDLKIKTEEKNHIKNA